MKQAVNEMFIPSSLFEKYDRCMHRKLLDSQPKAKLAIKSKSIQKAAPKKVISDDDEKYGEYLEYISDDLKSARDISYVKEQRVIILNNSIKNNMEEEKKSYEPQNQIHVKEEAKREVILQPKIAEEEKESKQKETPKKKATTSGVKKSQVRSGSKAPPIIQQAVSKLSKQVEEKKSKAILKILKHFEKKRYKCQVDSNVLQAQLNCILDTCPQTSVQPIYCKNCHAILNYLSTVDIQRNWKCEFCFNSQNIEDAQQIFIPSTSHVNYLLEHNLNKDPQDLDQPEEYHFKSIADDIAIIYLLDISRSMNNYLKDKNGKSVGISRLMSAKETIIHQMKDMCEKYPHRKVGLIVFSTGIWIHGDGTQEAYEVDKTIINDYEKLVEVGKTSGHLLQISIKDSFEILSEKIQQIKTDNATALGSGMTTAISLATLFKPGSQVIVCTDGLCNGGLGNLKNFQNGFEETQQFYQKIGILARDNAVTVHLVTIIGEECRIDAIQKTCEVSGGQIERVDPNNMRENFEDFLSQNVIATQVDLTLQISYLLKLKNVKMFDLHTREQRIIKYLGNITEDVSLTLEYSLEDIKQIIELYKIDLRQVDYFPVQIQIAFTGMNGSKNLRVINEKIVISQLSKNELLLSADYDLLCLNAIQTSANLCKLGNDQFKQALVYMKAQYHTLKAIADQNPQQEETFKNFENNITSFYKVVQSQMEKQIGQTNARMNDEITQKVYAGSKFSKSKMMKKQTGKDVYIF
eukprot:403358888